MAETAETASSSMSAPGRPVHKQLRELNPAASDVPSGVDRRSRSRSGSTMPAAAETPGPDVLADSRSFIPASVAEGRREEEAKEAREAREAAEARAGSLAEARHVAVLRNFRITFILLGLVLFLLFLIFLGVAGAY